MPTNIYQPDLMEVVQVRQQTADVKSVRIRFRDEARAGDFHFRVGQFGIFSAFGAGESPFNLCSSSNWQDFIEFCFRRTGRVTEALWNIDEGDIVGFRGPYGNAYPMDKWRGKNLIFIGGGIAMPPDPLRDLVRPGKPRAVRPDHDRLRRAEGGRPGLSQRARPLGRVRERAGRDVASIRAARRPTGRARSVSCRRWSSGPASRPRTRWRW